MTMENEVKDSVLKRAWRTVRIYYAKALDIGLLCFVMLCILSVIIGLGIEPAIKEASLDTKDFNKVVNLFAQFLLQPLVYGASIFSLYAVRRNGPKFSMLFCGFNDFKRIAGTLYLRGIYIFLWGLLFIIPGIIRHYDYAMTPFLLHEHPELKFKDALERSKNMMDGHKADLFVWELLLGLILGVFILLFGLFSVSLILSYGALILSYSDAIIVLIFVFVAWVFATFTMLSQALYAEFYEDLKGEINTEGTPVEPKVEQTIQTEEPESPKPEASQGGYAKDYR